MLDFGWAELLIIVAVAVFVIGPKDIPNVMYGLGRIVRRMQYVRFAITKQFDDLMQAADIEELRRGVNFEGKHLEKDVSHDEEEDSDITVSAITSDENQEEPEKELKNE